MSNTKKAWSLLFLLVIFLCVMFMYNSCAAMQTLDTSNLIPQTADKDGTLPSLRINECTFHLETQGNPDNPAIVFMHGGAGDYQAFLSFAESYNGRSLTDQYFLIFFDQRGKGLSERFDSNEEISFKQYLLDLEAIVDYFCKDEPVRFIAHSFGGILTAQYMNKHPDRIAGAVLLEPGPFNSAIPQDQTPLDLSLEWINDLMWGQQFFGAYSHEQADLNFAALMLAPDFNIDGSASETSPFWRVGAAAEGWLSMERLNNEYDYSTRLNQIDREILFLTGTAPSKYGSVLQRRNMEFLNHSRLIEIENAGHSDLIWADRDRVIPLIIDFFLSASF